MKVLLLVRGVMAAAVPALALVIAGCATTGSSMKAGDAMSSDKGMMEKAPMMAMDPMKAEHASIDRFSSAAGHLQVRDSMNHLPGPNQAVDFDKPPFVTTGLGPHGETVMYYNFDVQPTTPAPIYVLYRAGESSPVAGQLNIVDVIPGDKGYNDFWQVNKVTVPADYTPNSIGSVQALKDAGYTVEQTSTLVNCPIVPEGSTAKHRLSGNDTGLHHGWYRNKIVSYFNFGEAPLMVTSDGMVPVSPIYVTFNVNPGMANGGPSSGFKMAMGSMQTHNVVATLPGDMDYSPLWAVSPYDNMYFEKVMKLDSVMSSMVLARTVADVNCPIYSVEKTMMN
jgi:hypothetical protein